MTITRLLILAAVTAVGATATAATPAWLENDSAAAIKSRIRADFPWTVDEFAERAVKTIDSDATYRTIPWQMGLLAKAMRIAPNCLWDKIVANRKQKPRRADKQKAEAEAAQRK